MTAWGWLLVLAFVGGVTVLLIWLKRQTKTALDKSDQQTQRAFERRRKGFSGISALLIGAAWIAVMLINWRRVPVENQPFAIAFIVSGFAAMLYGTYKLYGARND